MIPIDLACTEHTLTNNLNHIRIMYIYHYVQLRSGINLHTLCFCGFLSLCNILGNTVRYWNFHPSLLARVAQKHLWNPTSACLQLVGRAQQHAKVRWVPRVPLNRTPSCAPSTHAQPETRQDRVQWTLRFGNSNT